MTNAKYFIYILFSLIGVSIWSQAPIKWVFTDYVPANYVSENGEYKGFLVDIVVEAFENRLKIPVDISIYPWKRCQMLVRSGEKDIFVTIPTDERLLYSEVTEKPIWIKKRVLFTYVDHPRLNEISQLKGLFDIKNSNLTVLSYIGNGWVEENVEKNSDIKVTYSTCVEGMYKMLAQRRGDIIIEESILVFPYIKELLLSDKIVETSGIGDESGFHIFISKKSNYLYILEQLNETINKMWADGTIEKILDSYEQIHY
ncbi:MAG: transporter substrate-binding domain-containing protein [Spirochaetales bacterium]|nr:transporter substrate-binding domain-containing protein [Spirochaetales bacterium]